jgi:SAM-dependent methyltransferase
MAQKLYSVAHFAAAKSIMPDKITPEWCETMWTDQEINECKSYEYKGFIDSPCYSNYPAKDKLKSVGERDELKILDDLIANTTNVRSMISIGCGMGEKEFFLAKKYPEINITCIDTAPFVEMLNVVAKDLELSNITFRRKDLRDGDVGRFDLVFSMSVIYCISDEYISDYYAMLNSSRNDEGVIVVGCTAILSPALRLHIYIKETLRLIGLLRGSTSTLERKQIGWIRSSKFLISRIPHFMMVQAVFLTHHEHNLIPGLISVFSKR